MMPYQPYPNYKPSGVAWLGDIPEHWELKQLKHIIQLNPTKQEAIDKKKALCSFVPMEKLKLGKIILDDERIIEDVFDGYTYFRNGDVLMAKVTPCFENRNIAVACELTNDIGFGSTEIYVLRPMSKLDKWFIYYLIQNGAFIDLATSQMTGAGGLKRVPSEFLVNLKFSVPPNDEQTEIANYLDTQTAKIDTLISKQQQLITLLQEKRSSLISHVVTKGLNPHVKFKPSGVAWLGDVPEHWGVVGFKRYLESIVDYRGKTPEKVEEGVFLVTARNIKNGKIYYDKSKEYISHVDYEDVMSRGIPEIGDIIFTTEAPLGEVANVDDKDIALAQRVIKFRCLRNILDNYYSKYFMLSKHFQNSLMIFATGSTALGIKAERLVYLKKLIPPLTEQTAIANYLDTQTTKLDTLIGKAQQAITLLQERRSSLISAVVTGKIDVRQLTNQPTEV